MSEFLWAFGIRNIYNRWMVMGLTFPINDWKKNFAIIFGKKNENLSYKNVTIGHKYFFNKKNTFCHKFYFMVKGDLHHEFVFHGKNLFAIIFYGKKNTNIHKVGIHLLVWVYLSSFVFLFYTLKSFSVYLCHSSSFLLRV